MRTKLMVSVFFACGFMALLVAPLCLAQKASTFPVPALLAQYESGDKLFREARIKDKVIVYYHQRMVGDAIVERDRIVYQFDMKTGELLSRRIHWRDDVTDHLPMDLISAQEAAGVAGGEAETAVLQIMSPESIVFSFEVVPTNPCWIVRRYDEGRNLTFVAVDAVEGKIVGTGVLPSVAAFSMVGGDVETPEGCALGVGWAPFAQRARDWFEEMGYPTTYMEAPRKESDVRSQVQSTETALFYEIAHGNASLFQNYCGEYTYATDVHDWMSAGSGYEKMVFTFLHSCHAMCSQGPGTLAHEFRKGSNQLSAVVGYCGRTESPCWSCANNSDEWEGEFFDALSEGTTVDVAFDRACAVVPECLNATQWGTTCVCLEGDGDLDLVPTRPRKVWVSWEDVTVAPLNDPQYGWGVAWGDYDNDGDPDIFLANQQDPLVLQGTNKLFRNDGGTFVDVTGAGPLADTGVTRGAAWGDYDNDGDLDLYVANDGSSNKLLKNLEVEGQNDAFVDVTSAANLPSDQWKSWGVAWADYDGDGFLDFYVVNNGDGNKLFRNNGNGTFSDVTATVGPVGDDGSGRGAAWGDYDNDGDPDLYLVKYNSDTYALCEECPNRLFRNNGDGTFSDVTDSAGPIADNNNGMMAAWGDYDNDEDLDLYLVNYYKQYVPVGNKLFRNDGNGSFTDVTDASHGFNVSSGVACTWTDYDNDGDLDLLAVNRYTADRLYRNENSEPQRFVNAADAITGHKEFGSSAAWGDYDGDGDLDIYLASLGGAHTNRLFENHTDEDLDNNWLRVKVVGTESNRAGIGCRVRIEVNGQSQIREISGGTGRSQSDLAASFGLGSSTQVDVLEVDWPGPCHNVTVMNSVAANQVITITEGVYAPNCAFAFADDKPSCPFICPAGDASYNGHAPLRLEVTVKDGCGESIQGYDDFYVTITPSSVGTFKFCCSGTEPTVQSDTRMVASAPTNAEGKAWIDIYWGGGYDQALAMKCYLEGGEQIGGALESLVRTPDLNADCVVNQQDVTLFGQSYYTTNWWADFNCSGLVTLSDFAFLGTHNGHGCQNQQTQPLSDDVLAHLLKKPMENGSTPDDWQAAPAKFSLEPNVPNPFNPSTEVRYTVPAPGAHVSVEVFDVSGKRVVVLVDEYKPGGRHSVTWRGIRENGEHVPSGVYFCRLEAPDFVEQKKMVLLK